MYQTSCILVPGFVLPCAVTVQAGSVMPGATEAKQNFQLRITGRLVNVHPNPTPTLTLEFLVQGW